MILIFFSVLEKHNLQTYKHILWRIINKLKSTIDYYDDFLGDGLDRRTDEHNINTRKISILYNRNLKPKPL